MSPLSRKPSPEQAQPLSDFVKQSMAARQISLRKAAKLMEIDPSHLSRILNGETTPDAGVCNLIADSFGAPRVWVYALAGWLDLGDPAVQQGEMETLQALLDNSSLAEEAEHVYRGIAEPTMRSRFVRLLQQIINNT